ncbi:MAG TPA: hypothetical protein VFF06_08535 [Polyangia bacterium]|nr:hypothetical protein [Polyangia bacterium]
MEKLDRRRFLLLGVASGVAAAAGGGIFFNRRAVRRPVAIRPLTTLPEVHAFFGPLTEGAAIDRWTVVAIHDVSSGGIPVVMATAGGEKFQVDVLRRDERAPGVANTRSLSLYLHNQGDGRAASHEEHGLGAMALALALEEREAAGAPLPPLLTLAERNARFPRGAFSVKV